ncbi:ABC transporter ATP-binding protein [Arthrobacter glacialis]|uniref:ABC transporter ATP-binding protein n=1 Tax=Arthrobacter glacialis TaxID=1664 RepID=A0A2S4A1L8_ARTGL|nr:ABC transporter ATP-binding protein [Arthrobacter glacialis]POH75383.1 ABC transporter ATP-binding protein [Arthrobacter glacialis]
MLVAHQLHIDGRRHTLLPATSVEARKAQVLLIQADGQERRTALALALTGRMKPSTGTVSLGHDGSMVSLRRRSAIVDAPDVNAPENHLTVRSLTSEDLALVPFKFRDRTRPTEWLVKHGFRDILEKWVEELEPARLLHLQLELALANKDVDVVVVDSPDRHTADVSAWLPLLERTASGSLGLDPDAPADAPLRPLMVVGVVGRLPDDWDGCAAVAGNAHAHAVSDGVEPPAAVAAEPEPEPDEPAADSPAVETPAVETPASETAKHTTEEIQ